MPISFDSAVKENNMLIKRELHTKCVTPRRLSRELKDLLGDDTHFKVEMRHNVYNIESSKEFDIEELLQNCRGFYRRQSPREEFESILVTSTQAAGCS